MASDKENTPHPLPRCPCLSSRQLNRPSHACKKRKGKGKERDTALSVKTRPSEAHPISHTRRGPPLSLSPICSLASTRPTITESISIHRQRAGRKAQERRGRVANTCRVTQHRNPLTPASRSTLPPRPVCRALGRYVSGLVLRDYNWQPDQLNRVVRGRETP